MRNSRCIKDRIDQETNDPGLEIEAINWYFPIMGHNLSGNARFYLETFHPVRWDC